MRPECFGNLSSEGNCEIGGELSLPVEATSKGLAVDERHDVKQEFALIVGIVHRDDMGMLEARYEVDFSTGAVVTQHRGYLGPEHLEGDVASMSVIADEEDTC